MLAEAISELNYNVDASEVVVAGTKEGAALVEETERGQKDEERMRNDYAACLTIQPNRVLCGVRVRKG